MDVVQSGKAPWRVIEDSVEWDRMLAKLGGHPLQSALWGDARRKIDGIEDHRVALVDSRGPQVMARIEVRRLAPFGNRIFWIPRGPVVPFELDWILPSLAEFFAPSPTLLVSDEWRDTPANGKPAEGRPETIWIDLTKGHAALWAGLHQGWRRNVGISRRANVTVTQRTSAEDRENFLRLVETIEEQKGFSARVSRGLLDALLAGETDRPVSAHLFVASHEGRFAATALVMKSGNSIHYIAGASDRGFTKQRVGEALHWSIIEWGLEVGAHCYDLEGIDIRKNPGTYEFKRKMGGREIALPGKQYFAPSVAGHIVAALDRARDKVDYWRG